MINIFHHPSSSQFPLEANIPSYYTSNFRILSSNIKITFISLFYAKSSNVIIFFSKKLQYSKRRKKRRRKREDEMKKRRRQKERRKENEEKRKRGIKKSEKKENNMGNYIYHVNTYLYPLPSFHFKCIYQFYHSTPSLPFSINPYLPPSSSTSFGRIIRHQWYLPLYIISNLFICWYLL